MDNVTETIMMLEIFSENFHYKPQNCWNVALFHDLYLEKATRYIFFVPSQLTFNKITLTIMKISYSYFSCVFL